MLASCACLPDDVWHEVEAAVRSWESTQLGDLKGRSDGLICLTGGSDGPLGRLVRDGKRDRAEALELGDRILAALDAEAPEDWCDYADFSSNIHRLRNTGIEILLNAAGAHKFAGLPFVTGGAGVERMVELALSLNASGWALDLEAKGIALADYQAFFRKIKAAFEPHGLKLQYTAGHHFQNSNNFSALLPLVDYCFDMTTCE